MEKEDNVHILVNLTLHEAAVIKALRRISYGKVTVFMDSSRAQRLIAEESILINKEDGMELAQDLNIYAPEKQDISSEQKM